MIPDNEISEFLDYLNKQCGINAEGLFSQWQLDRGVFWRLTPDEIIDCSIATLNMNDFIILKAKTRSREACDCKRIIAHHLKSKMQLNDIGKLIGGLHYSTVLNLQQTYLDLYEADKSFRYKADSVIINLIQLYN